MKELDYITESYSRRVTIGDKLIAYPIVTDVTPGETVTDGWSQQHTAPRSNHKWELWQVVNTETNILRYFYWKEVKE